ncbi:hypothetical protein Pssp01_41600 [Pseudomonas sp. NBRC 100443]|nr:hypothetical protein Pssp01_41600 [Pseudomonas sp. NBRC 100443]
MSGTSFLADYIASLYDGVFAPMPEDGPLDNLGLYERSLTTDAAEGKVDQIIARALKDGVIDEVEITEIIAPRTPGRPTRWSRRRDHPALEKFGQAGTAVSARRAVSWLRPAPRCGSGRVRVSSYKLVCPHCASWMRIRTSDGKHIFLRVAYLQCTNEACCWAARAKFEMPHEMSPSGMPNPSVRLPAAPTALCREAMHQ